MKKILTLVAAAVMALAANATDYTDDLAITLNGVPTAPATAKITVTPVDGSDGLYDIVLNQFTFANVMLIGDVTIEDVKANSTDGGDGYAYFEPITKEAAITNGSSIAEMLENKVTVEMAKLAQSTQNKYEAKVAPKAETEEQDAPAAPLKKASSYTRASAKAKLDIAVEDDDE